MTACPRIEPARLLEEQLTQTSPNSLSELHQQFINTLLSAEANSACGAEHGTISTQGENRRDEYRHQDLNTRTGTFDIAIPKLREGTGATPQVS